MFLGRASAEDELCISVQGEKGRNYLLRITRDEAGPVYRLSLRGQPATELPGYAVLEAMRWLGVDRLALHEALEKAVAEQTLRQHEYFRQGRALLGAERARQVDEDKECSPGSVCIFAWAADPRVQATPPPKR